MAPAQPVSAAIPQPFYASLGSRIAAHLIDAVIAGSVFFIAAFVMRGLRVVGVWTPPLEADPIVRWHGMAISAKLAVIMTFIVSMGPIYLGLFQASAWQASFGKRLLHIYVTDEAGRRLRLARSLARSFAKDAFSVFSLTLFSIVTIAASDKKQALHDFAAKTVVVPGRPVPGGSVEPWRIVAAFGISFVWILGTFLILF